MLISKFASRLRVGVWIFLGVTTLASATPALARGASDSAAVQAALTTTVPGFDNRGQALIPTLVEIAASYKVPMGIEKVTPEALRRPVHITVRKSTLASLLDACVRQLPDYHWAVHEGAVDIYGEREWREKLNLFGYGFRACRQAGYRTLQARDCGNLARLRSTSPSVWIHL